MDEKFPKSIGEEFASNTSPSSVQMSGIFAHRPISDPIAYKTAFGEICCYVCKVPLLKHPDRKIWWSAEWRDYDVMSCPKCLHFLYVKH